MEFDVKRGQIYLADLNPVMGSEQGGVRPVVVIQNDSGNKYSPTVIVAAITSREKRPIPTHARLYANVLPRNSYALLEQIRTIDKSRLISYIGKVSDKEIEAINEALSVSIEV